MTMPVLLIREEKSSEEGGFMNPTPSPGTPKQSVKETPQGKPTT